MALCTQVDYLTLKNWNFLKDYTRYRKHLDTIVRKVYYSASGILGHPPSSLEYLEELLIRTLKTSQVWQEILSRKPHAPIGLHPAFLKLMARFLLDHFHYQD